MKSFLVYTFCLISLMGFAQRQSSKTAKIRQLLDMTGSGKLGVQVANSMIASFKKSYSQVDEAFWDQFAKEIKAEDLINLVIPIYDKYFTEADIDQLIGFYNSPIGKKSVETLPMITQESMSAGQAWGREIAEKAQKQLKEKGYLDK